MTADSSQFYPRTPVTRKVELTCFGSKEKIIGGPQWPSLSQVCWSGQLWAVRTSHSLRDRASGIGGIFSKYGVVRLGRQNKE